MCFLLWNRPGIIYADYFFFSFFFLIASFFLFVSCCIFHFASMVFYAALEFGWDELSFKRSAADFADASLLSIDSSGGKPQSCIQTDSTAMGRQKGWRGKELKACAGQIHQQTNQAAGISIMMPPVNCSWLEAYFTACYQSLCILLTLFHRVEAVQLYGTPDLHQFEINSSWAVHHRLIRVAGQSLYVQLLPVFLLPLLDQEVTLFQDERGGTL